MQVFLVLFKLLLVRGYIDGDNNNPKIAVNNHLLVWLKTSPQTGSLLQYQCIPDKNTSQRIGVKLMGIYSISIGRQQNESQLYFVVAGVSTSKPEPYMSKISVDCDNIQMNIETVSFNETVFTYGKNDFVVTVDPHGRFAIGYTPYATLFYDLISLKHWSTNITWSGSNSFFPIAIDIFTPFVYIVGYFITGSDMTTRYSKASLYLMTMNFNNSKYDVNFLDVWTSDNFPYDSENVIFLSVSINHYNDGKSILVGIPPANTIHLFSVNYTTPIRLQHISSKTRSYSRYRTGYGAAFAWLNQGKTLVVLCTGCGVADYAILYYYDMLRYEQITNDTIELSIFPNKEQVYPVNFDKNIRYILSSLSISSTLYGYNDLRELLVIPPSLPGYYSINYRSFEDVNIKEQIFSFIPNSVQCSPGTYKNDVGVWPCSSCKPTETNSSILQYQSNNSISLNCPQCTSKTACPLESLTEINWLSDIKQNGIYPESPETDIFDDVLLFHIFKTEWNFKSPFFILIIVLSIVLIITGLISLLKLSKRFASKQKRLIKFFRHVDLIGEGKLWFGGVISIILFVLAILAGIFGDSYHNRYPIEKQICDNTTSSCDLNNLYNAKFDTSLQFLSSSIEQHEQIFDLLNSQEFTLNIELINTLIHCGQVIFKYEENDDFSPLSCYTNDLILYLSTKLSVHNVKLKFILLSTYTIDAIRIGLSGSDARLMNNYVQKLNFSKRFNRTNQVLSHDPIINLQLTKSINITEALTEKDDTTYTGLWLPAFTHDVNQIFSSLNSSERKVETVLSVWISEMVFYIKNKQKPIARRSEIIFHTILFIGVCIDLMYMMLLLLRMWFTPIIIYFIHKLFHPNNLVYRLVCNEKRSSETAVFLEIQKLQQQNEIMSKRIDTMMELIHHSHRSIEQKNHSIIKEKF